MKKLLLLSVSLLISAVSFSQTSESDPMLNFFISKNKKTIKNYSIDSIELTIVNQINKLRKSNGLNELEIEVKTKVKTKKDKIDINLNTYCSVHSQNQLVSNEIYHSNIQSNSITSENCYILKVFGGWWPLDLKQLSSKIYDSWITSKLHTRNMLVSGNTIGIAIELYPINSGAGYDISSTMVIR